MDSKTFELQLVQLKDIFSKSRSNVYSDKKKEEHFLELHQLFSKIENSNYFTFDENELNNHTNILNYIFGCLEYLDNSTLNIIPFEIVACLEKALEDWVKTDNFIIVTSLSNKSSEFLFESFATNEYFNIINDFINVRYNIVLKYRLIRIVLPKSLSRDYLSSVVLYHELGHFVDFELNICNKLFFSKYLHSFPLDESEEKDLNHLSEYFADIFAAQYISNSSNFYLNHIAFNNSDSHTHPSTSERILVVNDFLSKKCNKTKDFNDVLGALGYEKLKIRYQEIQLDKTDLIKLIPQNIKSKEELHNIFSLGWLLWKNSETNFLANFSVRERYHILNNLIEKSISNYIIINTWEKVSSI